MVQGKEISPDFQYMQEQEKEANFNLKEEIKLSDLKTLLALDFSSEEKKLYSGSECGRIFVWDVQKGKGRVSSQI